MNRIDGGHADHFLSDLSLGICATPKIGHGVGRHALLLKCSNRTEQSVHFQASKYMRGSGDNEIHVQEGLQSGQQRLRGLLRPAEERVLLLQELARSYHGGVRGHAERLPRVLQQRPNQAIAGLDEPERVPQKQGAGRIGRSRKSSAPPTVDFVY